MPQPKRRVEADTDTISLRERADEAELLRVFSARMVEARRLAGISQMDAANAFGYPNSGVLSRIENGYFQDRKIPLLLPLKASRLYGVSVDYLFGLAEFYENSPQELLEGFVARSVLDEWQRLRNQDMAAILRLCREVREVSEGLRELCALEGRMREAVIRLVDHNPDVEKIKGMDTVLRAAVDLEQATARTSARMRGLVARRVKTDNPMVKQALASAWETTH